MNFRGRLRLFLLQPVFLFFFLSSILVALCSSCSQQAASTGFWPISGMMVPNMDLVPAADLPASTFETTFSRLASLLRKYSWAVACQTSSQQAWVETALLVDKAQFFHTSVNGKRNTPQAKAATAKKYVNSQDVSAEWLTTLLLHLFACPAFLLMVGGNEKQQWTNCL